jgi:hypothetical protein
MRSVKRLRVVTLLLALAMAAGPTLLDRCLVRCHGEAASASAVPACHQHAQASGQLSIHGTADCSHDHDGLPADSVSDARSPSFRHAQPAVASAAAFVFDLAASAGHAGQGAWRAAGVAPLSINPPLRL